MQAFPPGIKRGPGKGPQREETGMTIDMKRAGRRALLAACLAGALTGGAAQLALAADYHEAPILAEQVKAGKLPAVAERLPEHPRVITPVEQPGEDGGTLRHRQVRG